MARRNAPKVDTGRIFDENIVRIMERYKKGENIDLTEVESELVNAGVARIGLLRMNRKQEYFIRIRNNEGRTPRRRIFEGANKCLTYNSRVETPSGNIPIGKLWEVGRPFKVYAWDGEKKVIADASSPFKKPGAHQCYRITLADGRWVEPADEHRVLTGSGWLCVSDLHELQQGLQESSSGPCLSVLPSGVIHLSGKQLNYLENYSPCSRQYGVQLQISEDSVPISFPLRAGVQEHREPVFSQMGVQGNKHTNSRLCFLSGLLSTLRNALDRFGGRFSEFLDRGAYMFFQYNACLPPKFQQLSIAEDPYLQSELALFQFLPVSKNAPSYNLLHCGGNKIASYRLIPRQEVFDFEVSEYHNYFAGGLIHHNSGKTRVGIAEDIAHAMGFRPWLSTDDPDRKINVRIPNQGLIACETMEESVGGKIEPELRALIPAYCTIPEDWKNNTQGVLKSVTLRYDFLGNVCGSTIHIRSYNQMARTFEGIDYDWEHFDEPPPEDILLAAERGKVVTNAPSWFTMTPLRGTYIRNRFSIKAFNNGGDDQEVAAIRASSWENCQDWCRECNLSIPENDPEVCGVGKIRPINTCPRCGKVMGFVSQKGLEEYFKTLPPEEREAREEGTWLFLSGLVYKEIDRDIHTYEDFDIPANWMKIEAVDPHDARPTRWLFGAVCPDDIIIGGKPANRIYWFGYLLANGNIREIARQVKVKRAMHGYNEPAYVILDAKYGAKIIKTNDAETSWEEELESAGIKNIRFSHSGAGDVSLGHKVVKEYLKPQYSVLRGRDIPGMLFAREGCGGERGPWQDMTNYQWKAGTDSPEEDFKDMCDCVRYAALEQPVYKEPVKEISPELVKFLIEEKLNEDKAKYDPLSFGLKFA